MELVPLCRYKLPIFWEGFPQDFGVFQLEFLPIHLVEQWCWTRKPGSQSPFQFIPKVFDGVEVRVLSGPVKFFHVKLIQLTMSLCTLLCALKHSHAGIETAFPKLFPQSWKQSIPCWKTQHMLVRYVLKHVCWFKLVVSWLSSFAGPKLVLSRS